MCFIVFAYDTHPDYSLILAANRDEFYERPAATATFWDDAPEILAGRDLKEGGTWMGVTRSGSFAALTNIREPHRIRADAPSRGELVRGFLAAEVGPEAFFQALQASAQAYNGYNMLAGDGHALYYHSNRLPQVQRLSSGIYAVSNHLLDTPWPKVQRGKARFEKLVAQETVDAEALLEVLADTSKAPDDQLPATGVPPEWERALSSIFIETPAYGTRCSTVLLMDRRGQITFVERTHAPAAAETKHYQFSTHTESVVE